MFNLTTPTITIDNFIIHQDADGRYCLNDLHAASGGKDKDQPSNWMRAQQTQDLIAELSKSLILRDPQIRGSSEINSLLPVVTIKGGKGK
ncbi:KilA-N domain-containing protein [Chromatium okenii]|uniref:KilA-N domain-containing protein n=1 Tax=Chromatium okenii TaxID=61644 RepID=UPI0026EEFAE7|nr:KilA-N domain-containing protein [Chromatium okenii]MBV5311127.1 KilA-N domain-containing protein [Chromatium okenii]